MPDHPNTLTRSAIGDLWESSDTAILIFWIGACNLQHRNWTENAAQSWAVTSQTIGNHHQGLLVEILQFADFCPVLCSRCSPRNLDRVNRKVWLIALQASACASRRGPCRRSLPGRATPWVVIALRFWRGSYGLSTAQSSFQSCPVWFHAPN